MPAPYMARLTRSLAGTGGLDPMFDAAAEALQAEVGFRLLTVSAIAEAATLTATRVWSSCPAIFPAGQTKTLDHAEWRQTIMRDRRALVCNDLPALRHFFFDHADIEAAHCGAGINLPVVLNDRVIGVVNLFHQPHWFTQQRVSDAAAMLALMYMPLVLRGTP